MTEPAEAESIDDIYIKLHPEEFKVTFDIDNLFDDVTKTLKGYDDSHPDTAKLNHFLTQLRQVLNDPFCDGERKKTASELLSVVESRLSLFMNQLLIDTSFSASRSSPPELGEQHLLKERDVVIFENQILGSGSFGIVYAGTYCGLPVAVKYIKSEEDLSDAAKEAGMLIYLRHPYCCEYVGYLQDPFRIVTRRYPTTLESLLNSRTPSIYERFQIAFQFVSAVHYMHSVGVIHHDLKPDNVFIDDDGNVRVADFGLSEYITTDSLRSSPGNKKYMAPEKCTGRAYDSKCEVYSIGLMLWELFTGCNPVTVKTAEELYKKQEEVGPFYTDEGGKLYCQECSNGNLASSSGTVVHDYDEKAVCPACGKAVSGTVVVRAVEHLWHYDCFKCQKCHEGLTSIVVPISCGPNEFDLTKYYSSKPDDGKPPRKLLKLIQKCYDYLPSKRPELSDVMKNIVKYCVEYTVTRSSTAESFWKKVCLYVYRSRVFLFQFAQCMLRELIDNAREDSIELLYDEEDDEKNNPIGFKVKSTEKAYYVADIANTLKAATTLPFSLVSIEDFYLLCQCFPNFFFRLKSFLLMDEVVHSSWYCCDQEEAYSRIQLSKGKEVFVIRPSKTNTYFCPFTLCIGSKRYHIERNFSVATSDEASSSSSSSAPKYKLYFTCSYSDTKTRTFNLILELGNYLEKSLSPADPLKKFYY